MIGVLKFIFILGCFYHLVTAESSGPKGCVLNINASVVAFYEYDSNSVLQYGAVVDHLYAIIYKCRPNHILFGPLRNVCFDGEWLYQIPVCTRTCSSRILDDITFKAECKYGKDTIDCSNNIRAGTIAKISCSVGYREAHQEIIDNLICQDTGQWNYLPTSCEPKCGTIDPDAIPFASNAEITNITDVPWHTAIYKYDHAKGPIHQCGGSIISAKLIITAAHCFDSDRDPHRYTVVAGKTLREFNAVERLETQVSNISEISIPKLYLGRDGYYHNDLALVVLTSFLRFKFHIKPVCILWAKDDRRQIEPDTIGKVAGWGHIGQEEGLSEELRSIDLIVKSKDECVKKVTDRYSEFVNNEKFCVGHEDEDGGSVCQGDSGGGFAVSKQIQNIPVYYLQGVVSTSLSREKCGTDYYVTFTNIQYHKEMITNYFNTSPKACVLNINESVVASYEFNSTSVLRSGAVVDHLHAIIYKCRANHVLLGPPRNVCYDGEWLSQTAVCTSPKPNPLPKACVLNINASVVASYEDNSTFVLQNGAVVNHLHAIIYKCRPNHILLGHPRILCSDGEWISNDAQIPVCSRICSSKILDGITFKAECKYGKQTIDCSNNIRPGTIAKISCSVGYRKAQRVVIDYLICQDTGYWDYSPTSCEPECGTIEPDVIPLASNTEVTGITNVPWHTAIYKYDHPRGPTNICGGSIISAKLVITAAHCLEYDKDPHHYVVVAGKNLREFSAIEKLETQVSNVSEIGIPKPYLGSDGFYHNDLAVIVLDKFLRFKFYIKPICISWENYDKWEIATNTIGKIAGWGRVGINEAFSEHMKLIELIVKSKEECVNKASDQFSNFLNSEKFCVGYKSHNGEFICQGDSGAGFAASKQIENKPVYYLQGVLSTSLGIKACGFDYNLVFTNIQYHKEMIIYYLNKFKPK